MEKKIKDQFSDEILSKAINFYTLKTASIKEVRSNNNFIFEVNDSEGTYILRITHKKQKSIELLGAEHDVIKYYKENGIDTCCPIESKTGEVVNKIESSDGAFYSILYKKIIGKQYAMKEWNQELFLKWGMLVGKSHKIAKNYCPNGFVHRKLDWHYDFLSPEKYLPNTKEKVLGKIVENKNRIELLNSNREQLHMIHNDINPSNFIEDKNSLILFDFDDCHYDYLLSDIANAILHVLDIPNIYHTRNLNMSRDEMEKIFFDSFFNGYNIENSINFDISFLNALIIRRIANLYVNFYRSHDIESLNRNHPLVLQAFENAILNEEKIIEERAL